MSSTGGMQPVMHNIVEGEAPMWVVSTKPIKGDWKNDRVVNYKSEDGMTMKKISAGQDAACLKPDPVQKEVSAAWKAVDAGQKINHRAYNPKYQINQVFKETTYKA